jgi:hypothetical protein
MTGDEFLAELVERELFILVRNRKVIKGIL